MPLPSVPFYFLRHGETEWNRTRRVQGSTDIPLNDRGLAQAAAAAAILRDLPIAAVVASPLARARRTAEIVAEALALPVATDPGIAEIGFGPHEGTEPGAWFADVLKGIMPPGAEDFDGFVSRALAGIGRALNQPGPVLVVAHGGVFWAVERFCKLAPSRVVPNCQPIRLDPPELAGASWAMTRL